jgi:uncharacterized protein
MGEVLPHAGTVPHDDELPDPAAHKRWTGADDMLILENFRHACREFPNTRFTARIPPIPGVDDDEAHVDAVPDAMATYPNVVLPLLLPYHRLGDSNYGFLGRVHALDDVAPPSAERLEHLRRGIAQRFGERKTWTQEANRARAREATEKLMSQSTKKPKERVLVTGASTGIGAGLARRFARAGHDLVLVARSADKLEALAGELTERHGVGAVALGADLAKDGEVARLAAALKRRRLNIDVLVNNAGVNHQGNFGKMPPAEHQEIVRLNVGAATDMLAHFIPPMVARGYGRVLNVASTSSFVPVPFMATYAASKAYLLSLTESLSEELKGTGVTLTALCPGVTATPMMDHIGASNARFVKLIAVTVLDVEEVADAGYDACMRGQVIRIPGKVNLATTISSRAVPKWLSRRVYGFIGRMAN